MRNARLVLAVTLAGLIGVACGGGGDSGGGGSDGGTATNSVTMIDNEFQPSDPVVSAGSTLTLSNEGKALHTFTIEGDAIDEEVDAGADGSLDITLDAGSYGFSCKFHPEMTGTLTVQ